MREYLAVPLPPPPPPTATTGLPQAIDPSQSPIKAMLANVKGESLEKIAVSRGVVEDRDAREGGLAFDERKHAAVPVHAQKPKKSKKPKK